MTLFELGQVVPQFAAVQTGHDGRGHRTKGNHGSSWAALCSPEPEPTDLFDTSNHLYDPSIFLEGEKKATRGPACRLSGIWADETQELVPLGSQVSWGLPAFSFQNLCPHRQKHSSSETEQVPRRVRLLPK